MGDTTIAAEMRRGVNEIVATLGETITFVRPAERDVDPNSLALDLTDGGNDPVKLYPVEATVQDVEDHLIDGSNIKIGDRVATFLAGQRIINEIFVPKVKDVVIYGEVRLTGGETQPGQWQLHGSQVWNSTETGQRRQYEVIHISTNRVSGIDVSHEVILR